MALPITIPVAEYPDNALEPVISAKTMNIHRQLHAAYAENYVKALNDFQQGGSKTPAQLRPELEDIAFNGSGYTLHNVYFANMSPANRAQPGKFTLAALSKYFDSFENFMKLFETSANSLQGPGWAVLAWVGAIDALNIFTPRIHQLSVLNDSEPVLVLDVWEHAYFLDYGKDRASYIQRWQGLINWNDVERRLRRAFGEDAMA